MPRYYASTPVPPEIVAAINLGSSAEMLARRMIRDHGGPKAADMMEATYPGRGRAFTRQVYRKMLDAGEMKGDAAAIRVQPEEMAQAPTAPPAPPLQYRD